MKRRYWTAADEAALRRLYPDTPTAEIARRMGCTLARIYTKAHQLGLHKSAAYMAGPDACRLRRGDNIGAAYRFPKGHVPANKGLRRPGWAPGRMRETQFKPGQVSTRWDPEVYCVGALRITSDGQLDIKIAVGPRGWRCMARWVWEQAHGPIPRGMAERLLAWAERYGVDAAAIRKRLQAETKAKRPGTKARKSETTAPKPETPAAKKAPAAKTRRKSPPATKETTA